MTRSQRGVLISEKVEQSFTEIVDKARRVDELVGEIATDSTEQSQGIDQVTIAVPQMDKVTQANAAGAEESASASAELSAQAMTLRDLIGNLQQLVGGSVEKSNVVQVSKSTRTSPDRIQTPTKRPLTSRIFTPVRPSQPATIATNGTEHDEFFK